MEEQLKDDLRRAAEDYARAKGVSLPTLGRLAAGDWRFFERLTHGKTFTARKYDEVMCWFATNWPVGVAWPTGVSRPGARTRRVRAKKHAA
jgi:hypothetical protein